MQWEGNEEGWLLARHILKAWESNKTKTMEVRTVSSRLCGGLGGRVSTFKTKKFGERG